ncbi:MAG: hypothetical protein IIC22_05170 [Chloroflexi bacterium]|nr:hypothetical protein [Chloroflexota bacterium]
MLRILRRALIVVGLLVLSFVILVAATPQGRAGVRTALLIPQLLPGIPIKPQEWVVGDPTRREVTYPLSSGSGVADLYVPASGETHSGILLFLGVNPAGRDDPRVVGLASGFARAGIVVMIPWSDTMTQRRIAPEEIDNLVRAFQYLRTLDVVDPDRVGMGGFCVGASLSAVAAQDPRIRDDVRFVNFFGGYYDVQDLIKSVVTRSRFYEDSAESWNPDRLSVEVVTTHLIEAVSDPEERMALSERFLYKNSETSIDIDGLSTEGRAVYRLLDGPSLKEVDGLIEQLSAEALENMRLISPRTNIDNLKARVLIMHDREDALVPAEESRRLAEALGENRNTYYTEFSLFQHLDPTRSVSPPVYAREAFKFFLHMYNIIRELS